MIYCVEDDDNIRELMLYTLKSMGFDVEGFEKSSDFWLAMEVKLPDMVLLDIMLADEDGISILKRLRQNSAYKQIPVIMATAKGTEFDKVQGLDLGADDYLVKPFGMMEMVSRIKAVFRRTQHKGSPATIKVGGLNIDVHNYHVTHHQHKIELTLKEFGLLTLLATHPKKVFTRQELLDKVWGEGFLGESRTVDVHIGTLRTKLGEAGAYIKTVRGVGYRLEDKQT